MKKKYSYLLISVFTLLFCIANNAGAVIVTFDDVDLQGVTLSNTFAGIPVSSQTVVDIQTLANETFGPNNGITFSGGVLLAEPTFTNAIQFASLPNVYGTANAPSTGGAVPPTPPAGVNFSLTNEITIDISMGEQITQVEGLLINGLDTSGQSFLADYEVDFFTDGGNTPAFTQFINDLPSNQDQGNAVFEFVTAGMSFITQVVIRGVEQDFGTTQNPSLEWDFFIDTIAFNEDIENFEPIPVPAALPLFLSALLGGWIVARPRKPSDRVT